MHFDLSESGRVTMNGWVQIACPLSTLVGCPLWAVSGQYKQHKVVERARLLICLNICLTLLMKTACATDRLTSVVVTGVMSP